MLNKANIQSAFHAALPIMLGYVVIGIPCGILNASIGLNAVQVFLLSALFYSGAGQFMLPNMYLAGAPLASIIASISLVNTRQMLYSASFAPFCKNERKRLTFLFGATVTDESFGVNAEQFEKGNWSVRQALLVNAFSCASWTVSNCVGVCVGGLLNIPLTIAAFAMTSIFICLMCTQRMCFENVVAIVVAIVGVYACKYAGLSGPAILVGALLGVAAAFGVNTLKDKQTARVSGDKTGEKYTDSKTSKKSSVSASVSASANNASNKTNSSKVPAVGKGGR